MLTPNVERWRDAGGFEQVAGWRLYVQRRAGDGPLLLFLHGFPSSSYDWRALLAQPGVRNRAALLFDCLGFGLSDKPADVEYTLRWQADAAEQLVERASDAHPLTREEADDQWALLAHNNGHRIGHLLVNYMAERERWVERWHGAFRDWPGRLSLTWGLEDPVATTAVLDGLRALRPGVPVRELPGIGHYPQLERPDLIAAALDESLAEVT